MEKLDVKDRKILYHIEQDSRQSFRSIGKKVGLSKDVVVNRIKNLEINKIIQNYYTVIDGNKLGYNYLRIYLKFQYITPKIREDIINCFLDNIHTNVVVSVEGSYDLLIIFSFKHLPEIFYFWEKTLDKYRDYFESHIFSLYFQEQLYDYAFLLDEKPIEIKDRKKRIYKGKKDKVEIDEIDFRILKILASNARIPTVDIAKKLGITTTIIHYRIKKLIQLGVIQGFRTSVDFSKLGYRLVKCDIILKDHKYEKKIMNYIEKNPYLRGRDISLGYTDIEVTFYLHTINQLHEIVADISERYPDSIRNYKYFHDVTLHKYQYIP